MSAKILVVDDEPDLEVIFRQKFRKQIRKNEFAFSFAYNGAEALEQLKTDSAIDLVVTDINMPVMDGLTLLGEIEAQYPVCKSVVVSAYGDMENIRTAMNRGAFDFLTKPIDLEDLEITISKTLQMVQELQEKIKLQEQKEEAQQESLELEKHNRFIRETFGRFLTEEVVNTLLESPEGLKLGGEIREVTILMSDLRGFSSLSEGLAPDQVVEILNRYLEAMANIIIAHEGTIDEFIGDAILVIFGAPIRQKDHAPKAVACAVAMQQAMEAVNEANRKDGLPELEMGIGLNTGEVIVGNIGSSKRMKYGVVGSHVNLASRIESCTVGGQVLLSETTYQKVASVVDINQKLKISAKGFKEPVTIYDIKGISGEHNLNLSEAVETLQVLPAEIPLEYSLLEGKQLNEAICKGSFIKLSEKGGVIRGECEVTPLSTLKIDIMEIKNAVSSDLYAKVINMAGNNDGEFYAHFTAVPPEVKTFLQKL